MSIPKIKGIPKINETSFNKSIQFNSTDFKMILVGSYRLPQNCKLNGVITIQVSVAKAVKLTDNAAFPPAILLKKLDTFPPGQAAIIIIPKAKLGCGLMTKIAKNVNAGNKINCDKTPTKSILGFFNNRLND